MTDPFAKVEPGDSEERALRVAVEAKQLVIEGLVRAAQARAARGAETLGLEESIDYEQTVLAGYVRALENRRRELRSGGR